MSIKGIGLKGKHVVLNDDATTSPHLADRVVFAIGGFGCSPNLSGTAVFVKFRNGHTTRYERFHVERLATKEEVDEVFFGNLYEVEASLEYKAKILVRAKSERDAIKTVCAEENPPKITEVVSSEFVRPIKEEDWIVTEKESY